MSILIYHGAPGSYKTSSAVQEQLIPTILKGRKVLDPDESTPEKPVFKNEPRPIVTNVRGLTNESVREFFKNQLSDDWLDGCPVINVDTSTAEGREKWARWFHWVPLGAFLIVDEAQHVWPKRWKDVDLHKLNFPATEEMPDYRDSAKAAGRPPDFLTAFDMHRHYNWDIVLTTPNITKIHADIRSSSEGAYKHKNLAVLGALFKGRYTQLYHDANDNGNASDAVTIETKSIKKSTFSLYQSTATGNFSDTKAGTSIFKDPKILILLSLVFAPFGYIAYAGTPAILGGKKSTPSPTAGPVAVSAPSVPVSGSVGQMGVPVAAVRPADVPDRARDTILHPLASSRVVLQGRMEMGSRSVTFYEVSDQSGSSYQVTDNDVRLLGYQVNRLSACADQFVFLESNTTFIVGCGGVQANGFRQQNSVSSLASIPPAASVVLPPDLPPELAKQVQNAPSTSSGIVVISAAAK